MYEVGSRDQCRDSFMEVQSRPQPTCGETCCNTRRGMFRKQGDHTYTFQPLKLEQCTYFEYSRNEVSVQGLHKDESLQTRINHTRQGCTTPDETFCQLRQLRLPRADQTWRRTRAPAGSTKPEAPSQCPCVTASAWTCADRGVRMFSARLCTCWLLCSSKSQHQSPLATYLSCRCWTSCRTAAWMCWWRATA